MPYLNINGLKNTSKVEVKISYMVNHLTIMDMRNAISHL